MGHYRYTNLRRQSQPYHNQFSASPLHLQTLNQENDFESPAGWSGQVNQAGWLSPGSLAGFGGPGHPVNWATNGNQASFSMQGHSGPVNQSGMYTQGHMGGWGVYGNPVGWNQGVPMGWGNFMGQGRPGMFGGLIKVGKGALGGLGLLNNLISVGRIFF